MADVMVEYREKREREYLQRNLKKKFYREFSESDLEIIGELQDYMRDCYLQIPPFVLARMVDRGIIPQDIGLFDGEGQVIKENLPKLNHVPEYLFVNKIIDIGMPFEFSNEGVSNPYSPYRMVWAAEFGGNTYFMKTALPPQKRIVRVVDVWKKKGAIPLHPLSTQREYFERGEDWNTYDLIEEMMNTIEEHDDADALVESDGHLDGHREG